MTASGEVDGRARRRGLLRAGWMESPLRGGEGNTEFLVHASRRGGGRR